MQSGVEPRGNDAVVHFDVENLTSADCDVTIAVRLDARTSVTATEVTVNGKANQIVWSVDDGSRGAKIVRRMILALSLTGCFGHIETSRNLPAHLRTKLEEPPTSLRETGIADKGEDTGMKVWLGHTAVYMGGAFGTQDRNGGRVALEVGATPFELDRFRGPDAPFEAQPTIWWRPSVGVVLYDDLQQSRIGAARDGSAVGPLYGEFQLFPWQGSKGFGTFMVGLGGQVSLATTDGGPQATACGGPFIGFLMCVRGSYLANAGAEFGIFVNVTALGTLGWAK